MNFLAGKKSKRTLTAEISGGDRPPFVLAFGRADCVRNISNSPRDDGLSGVFTVPMLAVAFLVVLFCLGSLAGQATEGEIRLRSALPTRQPQVSSEAVIPIPLRLAADAQGELAEIKIGDRTVRDFHEMASVLVVLAGEESANAPNTTGFELELNSDENLRYECVIEALAALSNLHDERGRLLKLIDTIRFKSR